MATRGTYGVKLHGNHLLNYHHYDSYPGLLGKEVCALSEKIASEDGWERFREAFQAVEQVYPGGGVPEELVRMYRPHWGESDGVIRKTDWLNLLSHLPGAKLLEAIYEKRARHFPVVNDFIRDPLCLYGYILNLDEMVLEYYHAVRIRSHAMVPPDGRDAEVERRPCSLIERFNLNEVKAGTYLDMPDYGE